MPALLPAAAAAELPGQKQPGAVAALEGVMCAPDVAETAPLLLSEPAWTGSCTSVNFRAWVEPCTGLVGVAQRHCAHFPDSKG